MTIAQWAAVAVIAAVIFAGVWAYAFGDRRVAYAYAGLALLAALCISISLWGPHAGEHQDAPGGWHTAPLKP